MTGLRDDVSMGFHIANEPQADSVLDEHPFAVLVGMALDQQYGMEHAFRGGAKLLDRLGALDPGADRGDGPGGVQGGLRPDPGDPPVPRLDGAGSCRA